MSEWRAVRWAAAWSAMAWLCTGCAGPLDRGTEDEAMRQRVMADHRRALELHDSQSDPDLRSRTRSGPASSAAKDITEIARRRGDVERRLSAERLEELDALSGARAYEGAAIEPGADLTGGSRIQTVSLSLSEAVRLAVEGNLDLAAARLTPRIAAEQVTQAEAAFDAVLVTDVNWQKLDTPQPAGVIPGLSNDIQQENFALTTGLRKAFTAGTQAELTTTLARNRRVPSFFTVDRYYDADVLLSLSQPLLRNFGSDVNTSQIVLARNAEAGGRAQVRQTMDRLVADVETAYWQLDVARRQVLIRQRLLERTVAERDRLQARAEVDVSPVQVTEANSRVELRRADLIRVRAGVRSASDRLKRLLNSARLPLADETLVIAADEPVDAPVALSLLDAVTTALERRPELERSLLDIDDARIRRRLADNATLPLLDLTAALAFNGIDTDAWDGAYDELAEGNYLDYILGLRFELPLGNRSATALLSQRTLERERAVLAYRRDAQDVVLEVKNALRGVLTNYELVGATRAARLAAADSLRAINVQEEVGVALTGAFLLDLKLNAQERLAEAEYQEAAALADYMTALAELHRATGTLARRHGVEVSRR